MNFKPVDRLPLIEWAGWWDETIERWHKEGLPKNLTDQGEIREYFGLDTVRQYWLEACKPTFPEVEYGESVVSDMDSYIQIKKHLYPEKAFDKEIAEKWAIQQKQGDMIVWITLEGFFWFPRKLFGIEQHLYAFYDKPKVMHAMNQDLLEYNLRVLDQFSKICRPDFMTFVEDMSYNNGPMISKSFFDEFLTPYYKKIVPKVEENGIIPFVDSDGDISKMVPWFAEVGVEGFLPLEKQAGIDIVELRKRHPKLKIIGGYDKMVMSKGELEMRAEFERILPVMKQGRYIPSVDHQTPPEVSFENYKVYLQLLSEYCLKAVQ